MKFNTGLQVKEEMTINEEGEVLDRKIINSNENTERFPFLEMFVISQSKQFILVQLPLKNAEIFFNLEENRKLRWLV